MVQEGKVVGLLQVWLLASTLEQIEEVRGRRREPGVDRRRRPRQEGSICDWL